MPRRAHAVLHARGGVGTKRGSATPATDRVAETVASLIGHRKLASIGSLAGAVQGKRKHPPAVQQQHQRRAGGRVRFHNVRPNADNDASDDADDDSDDDDNDDSSSAARRMSRSPAGKHRAPGKKRAVGAASARAHGPVAHDIDDPELLVDVLKLRKLEEKLGVKSADDEQRILGELGLEDLFDGITVANKYSAFAASGASSSKRTAARSKPANPVRRGAVDDGDDEAPSEEDNN